MTGWPALLARPAIDASTRALMTRRAEAIAAATRLDATDLRGWHFVATGALLLHESPYGRATMNGRYGFVHDDHAACREVLVRALAVAHALALPIERVYAPPDRASAIVALAASALFGCPASRWSADEPRPGLVIVHDLARTHPQVQASLAAYRAHQPLLVVGESWTDPPAHGADLVGSLHQYRRAPWDGGQGLDASTGAPVAVPPDDRPIAELARAIVEAAMAPDALADLPDLEALARAARGLTGPAAAGFDRSAGPRPAPTPWSPVESARLP